MNWLVGDPVASSIPYFCGWMASGYYVVGDIRDISETIYQGDGVGTALIQVCAELQDEKTRSREVRALLKASRELGCDNLFILSEREDKTENAEWFGMTGTVRYVPLREWLESPEITVVQDAESARSPAKKKR